MKIKVFLVALLFGVMTFTNTNAQSYSGQTWSYTTRVYGSETLKSVSSYFYFSSPSTVVWLLGTSDGYFYPFAIGKYNPSTEKITFSKSNVSNIRYIEEDVVFDFHPQNNTMQLLEGQLIRKSENLSYFYNNNKPYTINLETPPFQSYNDMDGQTWSGYHSYNNDDNYDYITITFNSNFEANVVYEYADGKTSNFTCPYILLGNNLAILTGDKITHTALIGFYDGSSSDIRLCMYAISGLMRDITNPCIELTRKNNYRR